MALTQRFPSLSGFYLAAALVAVFLGAPVSQPQRADAGAQVAGRLGARALAPAVEDTDMGFLRSFLDLSGRRNLAPDPATAVASGSSASPALTSVAVLLLLHLARPARPVVQPSLRGPPHL